MKYCTDCNRYFEDAKALQQHRQDSPRHAFVFPSRKTITPVRLYAQTTTTTTTSGSEMAFFGASTASPATQTARSTAGDDSSKDLISSLKGYDHFALVVPPSSELAGVDNILRIGSTPAGSTQTS